MLNGRVSWSQWGNGDFPFLKSQSLGFILFCEHFSHSNITCIVFSSVYIFSFFLYTSFFSTAETSYNFFFIQIRHRHSMDVVGYGFFFLYPLVIRHCLRVCPCPILRQIHFSIKYPILVISNSQC